MNNVYVCVWFFTHLFMCMTATQWSDHICCSQLREWDYVENFYLFFSSFFNTDLLEHKTCVAGYEFSAGRIRKPQGGSRCSGECVYNKEKEAGGVYKKEIQNKINCCVWPNEEDLPRKNTRGKRQLQQKKKKRKNSED